MEAGARSLGARLGERHPFLTAAFGIFAAILASFAAVGAALPILPRFVHGPLGSGDLATGIVVGAFAVSAVVARPWAGRLADARGRRAVMGWGALLMALAGALHFAAVSVPVLVFARLVLGVGEGLAFTAGSAWIVDLAPVERRGQSIGLFGLSVWGGLSLGPALGEAAYAAAGYDAVWALTVLGPLVGVALVLRLPRDRPAPQLERPRRPLIVGEAVAPGFALALANVGYAAMAGFVGLLLAERDAGSGAAAFTAFGAAVVTTRLLFGRAPDRLGPRRALTLATALEAAGLLALAFAPSLPVAAVGAFVAGVGFSLLYPSLALLVVARTDARDRGAAMGSFTAFFDLGVGLGAPLCGAFAALTGYGEVFAFAAACAVIAGAVGRRAARPSAP